MAEQQTLINKGRYIARLAATGDDIAAAQALRSLCFRTQATDQDAYDSICAHVLVQDARSGTLVCCFRMLVLERGPDIGQSYAAQFYDLDRLGCFDGPLVEMGRFCVHPDWSDPDILRMAWGAITAFVDKEGIRMLFGCSSFVGTDAALYRDAFALLAHRYLAPAHWRPAVKAPQVVRFSTDSERKPDAKAALQHMPSLLRSYLLMGGLVSDHAVVDRQLNTLHVFTGLEIAAIPPARKRLLRAVAGATEYL